MIILAIDPGHSGAIATLDTEDPKLLIEINDTPNGKVRISGRERTRLIEPILATLIASQAPFDEAVIEEVAAMPKQGISSTFAFGYAAGAVNGLLAAWGVPIYRMPPRVWKGTVGLRRSKDAARVKAAQLFPHLADQFRLAKHHDRAEAALLGFAHVQLNRARLHV